MSSRFAVLVPSGGTPADHLPRPRRPTYEPQEILFLDHGEIYDGGSFLEYPSRRGWKEKDIYDPGNSGKSLREIAAFFQTWFFWGLLEDILRTPIHKSVLVRENKHDQQIITTRYLPELIHKWYDRDQYLSQGAQKRHATRVNENLGYMCNILDWWNVHGMAPFDKWTSLYLVMLGEYMQAAYKLVYHKAIDVPLYTAVISGFTEPNWFNSHRRWPMIRPEQIKTRMVVNGWCPSNIQRLYSTLLSHGIFYASMLEAPEYKSPPRSSLSLWSTKTSASGPSPDTYQSDDRSLVSHLDCSDFSCSAYQWRPVEYKTEHVIQDCTCAQSNTNVSDLVRILDKNQIPVIRLQNGIKILPAESAGRYVAISHVWSDGLGNPHTNGLPQCQVERIAHLVNNLYYRSEGNIAFWIDTLCCPVQPLSARAQAIGLILKTYKNADKVLVIDAYLQSISISLLSPMEILMMIHCSKWNRRLWTLQEQISAREQLYFQFNDKNIRLGNIVLIDSLPRDLLRFSDNDLTRQAMVSCLPYGASGISKAVWADYAILNHLNPSSYERLTTMLRMVPFRATSRASDEAICLGNLLGMATRSIVEAPDATRMEEFWSTLPNIPAEVIFWIGPRLQRKGFRWAPSTFLTGRDLCYNKTSGTSRLTSKGILVRYPGWMLGCLKGHKIQAQFHIMDTSEIVYMVSCLDGTSREYLAPDSALDPWAIESGSISESVLYLILQFDLDDVRNNGPNVCHDAILALAYGIEQDAMLVRYVCPVTVRKLAADAKDTELWRDCGRRILSSIEAHIRDMGLWSSSPRLCSGLEAIDFMGCSAVTKYHPWYVD